MSASIGGYALQSIVEHSLRMRGTPFVGTKGIFGRSIRAVLQSSWREVLGVALICEIGFTMSLFTGLLAFPDNQAFQDGMKIGIPFGSFIAAVFGSVALMLSPRLGSAGERSF